MDKKYQEQLIALINEANPGLNMSSSKVILGTPRNYQPNDPQDTRNTAIDISAIAATGHFIGTKTYHYYRIVEGYTFAAAHGTVTAGNESILASINAWSRLEDTITMDDVTIDLRYNPGTGSFDIAVVTFALDHLKYKGNITVSENSS